MKAHHITPRLTKAAVLENVLYIRERIKDYTSMSLGELNREYNKVFSSPEEGHDAKHYSQEFMIGRLLTAATYYVTNVLNLE